MNDNFIGHYRIIKKMGAGGMARVYLAVHRDVPNLRVVLKILTDHQLADRFKQEADKLALVDGHPNICRIRHFFDHGEDLVIAMDYIDGPTVEQKIRTSGPLGYDEAIAIVSQVLDVLDFAHSRGISHRDIKPSNIMLDEHGRVKVIDFGIAKGETDPSMTAVNAYAGTPDYMAPEQFGNSEDTNYALADIYAVGVSLYEMLCAELPFDAKDLFAIRDAKMFQEPKNPRRYRPDMSKHLEAVIKKAMDREPEGRFQSASEMKQFLLSGAARDNSRRTPPPTPAPVTVKPQGKKKSGVAKLLAAAAVLVVLAGAAYFAGPKLFTKESSESAQTEPARPVAQPPAVELRPAVLVSPIDGSAVSADWSPSFVWNRVEGASAYALEISNDPQFTAGVDVHPTVDTTFALGGPLVPGEHYWRVQVSGDGTPGEVYSEVSAFMVEAASAPPPSEQPTGAPGTLVIAVNLPSTISIDGRVRERRATEFREELDPGTYLVRVENSNSRERERTERVTVVSDEEISRSFEFTEIATGTVRVTSTPDGAQILINGEMQNRVRTPHTFTLGEGRYVIGAISETSGSRTMQENVEVRAGRQSDVSFDFVAAGERTLAVQLADSVAAVMKTLDDIARASSDFTSAQAAERAGKQFADGEQWREAVEQYRASLGSLAAAQGAKAATEREVKAALERFGQAYQSRDIDAVRGEYPNLPKDEANGWKQFFSQARDLTVKMSIDRMTVAATSAEVTVTVRMVFSDSDGKKDQSFRWLIQFEETGSNWVVAKRQTL